MVHISDKPMIIYFVFKKDEIVYIGQTVSTLQLRRGKHISEAKLGRGSVIGAGIRKHGEDAFEFKIHSTYYNQQDLCAAEKHYIAKYQPRYNVQEGGKFNFTPWNKGKKETRPEVLERQKDAYKKRIQPKRGPVSPDIKEKVADSRRKHLRETATPFICHQNGKTYWLKSDAAQELGLEAKSISCVLCPSHPMKTLKGYTFSYV